MKEVQTDSRRNPIGFCPMLDTVRIALGRPAPTTTVHECRHCGTTVSADDDRCPVCESSELASYEL